MLHMYMLPHTYTCIYPQSSKLTKFMESKVSFQHLLLELKMHFSPRNHELSLSTGLTRKALTSIPNTVLISQTNIHYQLPTGKDSADDWKYNHQDNSSARR